MKDSIIYTSLGREDKKAAIEAIIFSSEETVSIKSLVEILSSEFSDGEQIPQGIEEEVEELIAEINSELESSARPYSIVQFAGGYQFATKKEYGRLIVAINKSWFRKKLSRAALETLAIIAYKQPVTKPEIEQIRGVNSNEVVNALMEKELVKIAGRSDTLGKPLLFSTTDNFLKTFGLVTLKDLPKLRELDDLGDLSDISIQPDNMLDIQINEIRTDEEKALDAVKGLTVNLNGKKHKN